MISIKSVSHHYGKATDIGFKDCYFCGKNGVPIMVLVELANPVKFTYQTITIKGMLKLSGGNAMDFPPVSLIDATATQ